MTLVKNHKVFIRKIKKSGGLTFEKMSDVNKITHELRICSRIYFRCPINENTFDLHEEKRGTGKREIRLPYLS